MKAVLEFNLPEEAPDFTRAALATELALALHDIANALRNERKWPSRLIDQDPIEWAEDLVRGILDEHGIYLERLLP